MIQVIQYEANDGSMFSTEEACLQYERGCETQKHIINQYCREINQRNIVGRCMKDVGAAKKQVTSIQALLTNHKARIFNGQREIRDDWSMDDWLTYEQRCITYRHQLKTQEAILKVHKEALKRAEHDLNMATNKLHDMILKAYKDGDLDMLDRSVSGFGKGLIKALMKRFRIGPKYNK